MVFVSLVVLDPLVVVLVVFVHRESIWLAAGVMVLDVAAIARVAFTSEDRVRDVIRNFGADGFGSLYPQG